MMKKLALLLTAAMLLSLLGCASLRPANPASDFEYTYVEKDDYIAITDYIGTGKDVVVPTKIDGHPVKRVSINFNDAIESIALPNTMEKVGIGAFEGCTNLQKVVLGKNIDEIHDNAFMNCTSLKTINFPKGLKSIHVQAFKKCYSLEEAILPKGLETIKEEAFAECTALKKVYIPKTVTFKGSGQFLGAESLASITFENGTTKIGSYATFMGAKSLKEITIPDSVTEIGDLSFSSCTALEKVTFLGDAPETVGAMVFAYCNDSLKIYYNPSTNGWEDTPLSTYNLVSK